MTIVRRLRVSLAVAFAVVAGEGCMLLASLDDHVVAIDGAVPDGTTIDGDSGGSNDGGEGGSSVDAGADVLRPPRDARADVNTACILVDAGTKSYCIDATEVTKEQYNEFMRAWISDGGVLTGPPECSWNDNPTPGSFTWPAPDDGTLDKNPINNIDWCDAYAYCAWVGKHLCGTIADGGAVPPGAPENNPAVSEWYRACSAAGTRTYPYGQQYDGSVCNGCDSQTICNGGVFNREQPVGSHPGCAGGVSDQLLDMSGNVAEWENNCLGDGVDRTEDHCSIRGGGWNNRASFLVCTGLDRAIRAHTAGEIGFRCCGP
jgi:formylglycine-generating enzyme required for sulfatase activity